MKLKKESKEMVDEGLRKKIMERQEFKIGSGCFGETILFADNISLVDALTSDLGKTILNQESSYIDGQKQSDMADVKNSINMDIVLTKDRIADDLIFRIKNLLWPSGTGSTLEMANTTPADFFRFPEPELPYLTDSRNQKLSKDSTKEILELFEYRHGKNEALFLSKKINQGNNLDPPINLYDFIGVLKGASYKQTKRAGFLLELILHQFLNTSHNGKKQPTDKRAWSTFRKAIRIIRIWIKEFPQVNTDEEEIIPLPIPGKYERRIKRIKQNQWQAATVTAIRKGWLNKKGFLRLKQALYEATKSTPNVIELKLTPDIVHELMIQQETKIEEKNWNLKARIFRISGYSLKAVPQDTNLIGNKGIYKEVSKLILKELNFRYRLIDMWENISYRTKGKQVDPNIDFEFLALLSPESNRQEVIGANGQILGDGSYMFAIDPTFRIRYMPAANYVGEGDTAKNFVQFIPHSQLAARGEVAAAGNFVIKMGKFQWIDNGSGHYRVDPDLNAANAKAALENIGYKTGNIQFLDRGAHQLDELYLKGNQILDGLPAGESRPAMTDEIWEIQRTMEFLKK